MNHKNQSFVSCGEICKKAGSSAGSSVLKKHAHFRVQGGASQVLTGSTGIIGTHMTSSAAASLNWECRSAWPQFPAELWMADWICYTHTRTHTHIGPVLSCLQCCRRTPARSSHSFYHRRIFSELFAPLPLPLQASCLCGSASCLLSSCCPSAYNSTVSRLAFSFLLLLGTMVSVIMILPGMEEHLKKVRREGEREGRPLTPVEVLAAHVRFESRADAKQGL